MRITIDKYSPEWKKLFDFEKQKLESILGNNGTVEHIGSTAIEGLDAKPVIDIMIGLTNFADIGNYIQFIIQTVRLYIHCCL